VGNGKDEAQRLVLVTRELAKSVPSANGNCVEVANLSGDVIMVRDSKNAKGPLLGFTPGEWDGFVGGVRNREFDRRG
jgi:hypothetical protein